MAGWKVQFDDGVTVEIDTPKRPTHEQITAVWTDYTVNANIGGDVVPQQEQPPQDFGLRGLPVETPSPESYTPPPVPPRQGIQLPISNTTNLPEPALPNIGGTMSGLSVTMPSMKALPSWTQGITEPEAQPFGPTPPRPVNPELPRKVEIQPDVILQNAFQGVQQLAAGGAEGVANFSRHFATVFEGLDSVADWLSRKTGLSRGGAFKKIAMALRGGDVGWRRLANNIGGPEGTIIGDTIRALGSFPGDFASFLPYVSAAGPVLGFATHGAIEGARQGGLKGAATGAITGGLTAGLFNQMRYLPKKMSVPSMFAAMYASARGGGADHKDAMTHALAMSIFVATGQTDLRNYQPLRQRIAEKTLEWGARTIEKTEAKAIAKQVQQAVDVSRETPVEHVMPTGEVMRGPEHPGAVEGSTRPSQRETLDWGALAGPGRDKYMRSLNADQLAQLVGEAKTAQAPDIAAEAQRLLDKRPKDQYAKTTPEGISPAFEREAPPGERPPDVSIYDAIRKTVKDLQILYKQGGFKKNYVGMFKPLHDIIRTKAAFEYRVVAHELGHYVRKTLKIRDYEIPKDAIPELKRLGAKQDGGVDEGIAELVRLWSTHPDVPNRTWPLASEEAPRATGWLEGLIAKAPDSLREPLQMFKTSVGSYLLQDPRASARAMVKSQAEQKAIQSNLGFKDRIKRTVARTIWATTNKDYGFTRFKKFVEKDLGRPLMDKENFNLATILHRGIGGKIIEIMDSGMINTNREVLLHKWVGDKLVKAQPGDPKGFGITPERIFDQIPAKYEKDASGYLIYRRAIARKEDTGLWLIKTPEDQARKSVELWESDPAVSGPFKRMSQMVDALYDSLLNYSTESGLINADMKAKIQAENRSYVPLQRVFDEAVPKYDRGGGAGLVNFTNGLKRIKGSEREILDPLEQMVRDVYSTVVRADKNRILNMTADWAENVRRGGHFMERVEGQMKTVATIRDENPVYGRFNSEPEAQALANLIKKNTGKKPEIRYRERDESIYRDVGDYKDFQRWEVISSETKPTPGFAKVEAEPKGPDIIPVFRNGVKTFYQIHDRPLLDAILGLEDQTASMVFKIASAPVRLLRWGVTTHPAFTWMNFVRDAVQASIFSSYGFALPGYRSLVGLYHVLGKTDMYREWRRAGGAGVTRAMVGREFLDRTPRELQKAAADGSLVTKPSDLLHLMSRLSQAIEEGTRLGEYRAGIKRGRSSLEAAAAARDITVDFARHGAQLRGLNLLTAFFNANIQGLSKMGRELNPFKADWKRTVNTYLRASLLTAAAHALWAANKDDPEIQALTAEEQGVYAFFRIPGLGLRKIALPHELGVLFFAIPYSILDYASGRRKDLWKTIIKQLGTGPFQAERMMPNVMKVPVELINGRSMFWGQDIVPAYNKKQKGWEQTDSFTSATSVAASRRLYQALGIEIPAAYIDYFIRNTTGYMGASFLKTMDAFLKTVKAVPGTPDWANVANDWLGIERMIKQPYSRSRYSQKAHEIYARAEKWYNTLKRGSDAYRAIPATDREARGAALQRYLGDRRLLRETDPDIYALVMRFPALRMNMAKTRETYKHMRKIMSSDMTYSQKQAALFPYRESLNNFYKNLVDPQ